MYSFSHNAMVNNGLDGNLDKLDSLQKLPSLIIYHLFNTAGSLKRVAISKGLSFISKKQRGWKGLVKKINALTLTLKLIQRHSNPLIKTIDLLDERKYTPNNDFTQRSLANLDLRAINLVQGHCTSFFMYS